MVNREAAVAEAAIGKSSEIISGRPKIIYGTNSIKFRFLLALYLKRVSDELNLLGELIEPARRSRG